MVVMGTYARTVGCTAEVSTAWRIGVDKGAAGVHNEIRTRALVGIGELPLQHLLELFQYHAETPQHPLELSVGWRDDDDGRVDTGLPTGPQQQWHLPARPYRWSR
jgi:hypothetical protein